jgi:pyruvate formate lyase activating enzyme
MHEAGFYDKQDLKRVKCLLCPHLCRIDEGVRGKCKARININGTLYSEGYGLVTSLSIDPMEKKPLYHFFPGRDILSVGTAGCNFSCSFCQNYQISQSAPSDIPGLRHTSPELIVNNAKKSPSCTGVAYTYNEPTIWYEYMYDIAINAIDRNLKNVVVSNGYINSRPLDKLLEVIHAFNIDLKSFSDKFYRDVSGGTLAPVKRTMEAIRKKGLHLEITHLVVSGLNDDEGEFTGMTDWIAGELGEDTVLHISRYFPAWKLSNLPTPLPVIERFYQLAKERLKYVYTGNMPPGSGGSDTRCPGCGGTIIKRSGYRVDVPGLDQSGKCRFCSETIAVVT